MKRSLGKLTLGMFVICLVFSINSSVAAAGYALPRIYGGNRYNTAVEVSKAGWDEAEVVILARGDDFADALAGVPLAYANDAPILLTSPNRLVAAAEAEIQRLGASKVIILGGPGAIRVEVEEQLAGMGLAVQRIYGKNRYETAAKIASHELLSAASTAVLAYGKDYPDCLAAASYAAGNGWPILLTDVDRLPESTRTALGDKDVIVVGGNAVVGQAVIDGLRGAVTRISGHNRAATSVELAKHFQPGAGKMYIATGYDFADALTGSVLAAKEDSGLLLVSTVVSSPLKEYLQEFEPSLTIFGGTGAVSREVEDRLFDILAYVGEHVEFLRQSSLSLTPGGEPVRFPYKGHVALVLDASKEYVKIKYGSKGGWVPRADVKATAAEIDYIRLTWNYTSAGSFVPEPPNASGYNVYAPVSHSITVDSNGVYKLGVHTEINTSIAPARRNGYFVWMTVQQFGSGSNLSSALAKDIVAEALRLDVDGINIDFENMGLENRDKFTSFMDKLEDETKKYGLTLSVDVTRRVAGSSWSLCYNRTALGRICDYVALMAYDQTPAGSSVAGPVAAYPWTRSAVDQLLEEVPAEKILLGIPFFNRFWRFETTSLDTDSVRATGSAVAIRTEPTTAGGAATVIRRIDSSVLLTYVSTVTGENISGNSDWHKVDLGAEGIGYISAYYSEILPAGTILDEKMGSGHYSQRIIIEMLNNYDPITATSQWSTLDGEVIPMTEVSVEYDSSTEYNILSYKNAEGHRIKIWVEDATSLRRKLNLALEKRLAGVAAWSFNWMDGERQLWNHILEE